MTATSVMHREEWPIAWQKAWHRGWREEASRLTRNLIKALESYENFMNDTVASDVCPLHPKYKARRKPTSKKAGCICGRIYAAKTRRSGAPELGRREQ